MSDLQAIVREIDERLALDGGDDYYRSLLSMSMHKHWSALKSALGGAGATDQAIDAAMKEGRRVALACEAMVLHAEGERDALRAQLSTATARVAEAEDLLEDAIYQGCSQEEREGARYLDSCAISTWADGLRWLAKRGKVEIASEHGRRVIARAALAGKEKA